MSPYTAVHRPLGHPSSQADPSVSYHILVQVTGQVLTDPLSLN